MKSQEQIQSSNFKFLGLSLLTASLVDILLFEPLPDN